MEFLILLLERRGQLVTREEIVSRLWPNPQSIDIGQGINTAVNRIRAVLNEDAAKPLFIETVVGKGYRFTADVEEIAEEPSPQPAIPDLEETDREETEGAPSQSAEHVDAVAVVYAPNDLPDRGRSSWGRTQSIWTIACLLLVVGIAAWFWRRQSSVTPERASRTERSSDPKKPVFQQVTTLIPENRATAAAISPDGRLTVYANIDGIFLRTESGETNALRAPANFIVDRLAWFPDLTKIVASGFSSDTKRPSLWTISVTGAPARSIRLDAREGTPSPDGTRIVFCADRSAIWTVGASGEDPRLILKGLTHDRFDFVFWSAVRQLLNLQRFYQSLTRSGRTYESADAATGRVVSKNESYWMSSGAPLVDGRVLFLRWDNEDFTSSSSLWELSAERGGGQANKGARKIAELSADGATLLGLSATSDGTRALMLRRTDQNSIFLGDLNPSPLKITNIRRLTLDERNNYPHSWTADSRFVIFESNRNGNYDLLQQGVNERTAEAIVSTPATEILPQLGGRFILYAARAREDQKSWYYQPQTYKLMRVLVSGGIPEEVPLGGNLDEFRCPLDTRYRCILRSTQGHSRTYYELDPVHGRGRELARIDWSDEFLGDWDVSPDGTEVAIPNHDAQDARIRVGHSVTRCPAKE